jgi:hypothetical protein
MRKTAISLVVAFSMSALSLYGTTSVAQDSEGGDGQKRVICKAYSVNKPDVKYSSESQLFPSGLGITNEARIAACANAKLQCLVALEGAQPCECKAEKIEKGGDCTTERINK